MALVIFKVSVYLFNLWYLYIYKYTQAKRDDINYHNCAIYYEKNTHVQMDNISYKYNIYMFDLVGWRKKLTDSFLMRSWGMSIHIEISSRLR